MTQDSSLTWSGSVRRSFQEAQHALEELNEVVGPIRHSLEQVIADHPVKAAALSLATGVFLGWLIKR